LFLYFETSKHQRSAVNVIPFPFFGARRDCKNFDISGKRVFLLHFSWFGFKEK
jgi:hypothetical protein